MIEIAQIKSVLKSLNKRIYRLNCDLESRDEKIEMMLRTNEQLLKQVKTVIENNIEQQEMITAFLSDYATRIADLEKRPRADVIKEMSHLFSKQNPSLKLYIV